MMDAALVAMSHDTPDDETRRWLSRFHAGETAVLNDCYREHFDTVRRAAMRVLPEVDAETVIHDVFLRLVSSPEVRRSFQGGSLSAWLTTLARNQALDVVRRRQREAEALSRLAAEPEHEESGPPEPQLDAGHLLEHFRKEKLPPKWAPVFEARFVRQLSQREAAAALRMRRTTLAYQELRVRHLLEKFLLSPGARR
jgi:RNA polymerase sigma-70 factor (ECF subfamily)